MRERGRVSPVVMCSGIYRCMLNGTSIREEYYVFLLSYDKGMAQPAPLFHGLINYIDSDLAIYESYLFYALYYQYGRQYIYLYLERQKRLREWRGNALSGASVQYYIEQSCCHTCQRSEPLLNKEVTFAHRKERT